MNRRGFLGLLAAAVTGRKFWARRAPHVAQEVGISLRYVEIYEPVLYRFVNRIDVNYGWPPDFQPQVLVSRRYAVRIEG